MRRRMPAAEPGRKRRIRPRRVDQPRTGLRTRARRISQQIVQRIAGPIARQSAPRIGRRTAVPIARLIVVPRHLAIVPFRRQTSGPMLRAGPQALIDPAPAPRDQRRD